ncbi:MAG: glutathione S-transferase family protein [Pseudomonadota bacterium]
MRRLWPEVRPNAQRFTYQKGPVDILHTIMRRLFHTQMDPKARLVRLVLAEKGLPFQMVEVPAGMSHPDVKALAPGAMGVALIHRAHEARYVAVGSQAICEYLEEAGEGDSLLPRMAEMRAESRRLWRWCEDELLLAVETLLAERITMATKPRHIPDSKALRMGAHSLRGRLTFLNHLAETRAFIAGRVLTLADLALAAHLSCFDYFNDVPWDLAPDLRDWYGRMKSRPSFRPLLADTLEGSRPAAHYADLDF